jgi:DNA-binding SARP family transcriptional activator
MLGRFEVEQGGKLLEDSRWRSGKARSLFKILLSRHGYQISRQEVSDLLWPELDPEKAANNLYQALYNLRRTLEPDLERAGASIYLKTEGSKIQLEPSLVNWVDLEEFNRLYRQSRQSGDPRFYEQALALYRGDYLPEDLYEDWASYRRESLREQCIDLLLRLATFYQQTRQLEKNRQCLYRVLETNFSHEEAAQKLMLNLARYGKQEEAIAFYHSFSRKLKVRLNLEPLPETWQLFREISNQRSISPTTALNNIVVRSTN